MRRAPNHLPRQCLKAEIHNYNLTSQAIPPFIIPACRWRCLRLPNVVFTHPHDLFLNCQKKKKGSFSTLVRSTTLPRVEAPEGERDRSERRGKVGRVHLLQGSHARTVDSFFVKWNLHGFMCRLKRAILSTGVFQTLLFTRFIWGKTDNLSWYFFCVTGSGMPNRNTINHSP